MSTLYITEFCGTGLHAGVVPVGEEPDLGTQVVTISGSHAESNALKNNTQLVRLHTDAICSVVVGASPVATTSNFRMAANQTEYFSVPVASGLKISVISNT